MEKKKSICMLLTFKSSYKWLFCAFSNWKWWGSAYNIIIFTIRYVSCKQSSLLTTTTKEQLNFRWSVGVAITKPCESLFASGRDVWLRWHRALSIHEGKWGEDHWNGIHHWSSFSGWLLALPLWVLGSDSLGTEPVGLLNEWMKCLKMQCYFTYPA